MKDKNYWAISAAIGAAIFWSFSFVWFKIANLAYEPITIIFLRLLISTLLLSATAWGLKQIQKPKKKDLLLFLLMAFFEPFIYFLGESYGLKYVSSTVAAVIVATIPLLSPFAAWYFYKEKISRLNGVGLALSFIGVSLVVLNKSLQFNASPLGVGLEFIAVFAAIAYSIVLKKLTSRYNTLTLITYQNLIGIFLFLPLWLMLDLKTLLSSPFHPQAFRAIVMLAIFSSSLAFVLFTQSIKILGITKANIYINLIPVLVAILSYFILKDSLGVQKVIGILVVIIGLFLAQSKKKKTSSTKIIKLHQK